MFGLSNLPPIKVNGREIYLQFHKNNTFSMTYEDGTTTTVQNNISPVINAATKATVAVGVVSAAVAVGVPAAVAAGLTAAVTTAHTCNNDLVDVDEYYRKDGTHVQAHHRTWPDGWEGNNFTA